MPPPARAAAACAAFSFWTCWGVSEERGGKGVLDPLTPPLLLLPPLVDEAVDCALVDVEEVGAG